LVIVKVIPGVSLDSEVLAWWRGIRGILATPIHPAIIPILDVESPDGGLAIIEPLIEGRTLSERLRLSGRMDPREAAALVVELAEALHLAHHHGLVHGDINPSNILLGDDRRP